jgi:hypothetical protein
MSYEPPAPAHLCMTPEKLTEHLRASGVEPEKIAAVLTRILDESTQEVQRLLHSLNE